MALNNLTEEELVRNILAGNKDLFGIIINNTKGLVCGIVYKMINDNDERKDVVQETYLKVFKGLGKFEFKSKLSSWIGSVAYNICINALKKKRAILVDIAYEDDSENPLDTILNKKG